LVYAKLIKKLKKYILI